MATIVVFLSILMYPGGAESSDRKMSQVESHIRWFLQGHDDRINAALQLEPVIISESESVGFDPLLVSVIISLESSYRSSVVNDDSIGEIGLMQVAPKGVCARGQDLTTPEGQIKAGLYCLRLSRDVCGGDLRRILTMYASGKCVSGSTRTHALINRRLAVYEKAKARFAQ
jgi:hypothetical protein